MSKNRSGSTRACTTCSSRTGWISIHVISCTSSCLRIMRQTEWLNWTAYSTSWNYVRYVSEVLVTLWHHRYFFSAIVRQLGVVYWLLITRQFLGAWPEPERSLPNLNFMHGLPMVLFVTSFYNFNVKSAEEISEFWSRSNDASLPRDQ